MKTGRQALIVGLWLGIASVGSEAEEFTDSVSLVPTPGRLSELSLLRWPSNGWAVQQYEDLVEIRFSGEAFRVDSTAVGTGSASEYVSELNSVVSEDATILRLRLACACTVAVHGSPDEGVQIRFIGALSSNERHSSAGHAPLRSPAPVPRPLINEPKLGDEDVGQVVGSVDPEEARERLLKQLLRAAEAGLVSLDQTHSENATLERSTRKEADQSERPSLGGGDGGERPATSKSETSDFKNASILGKPADDNADLVQNYSNPSAPDLTDGHHNKNDTNTEGAILTELRCHNNEFFILPSFHSHVDIVERIATLRAFILGEFDRPDPEMVLDLAKLYLVLGLSHEARNILQTFGSGDSSSQIYMEQIDILDGKKLPSTALLLTDECLGDQAIWRAFALARSGDAAGALQAERTSGRALERMPIALREQISSTIGLAAVDEGNWSVARRMEAMAIRAGTSKQLGASETLLLVAKLARSNLEHESAIDALHTLIARREPLSADGLLVLAEMVISGEAEVSDNAQALRTDLGALAREMARTPLGILAYDLEVRLADLFGDREEALDLLAHGVDAGLLHEKHFVDKVTALVDLDSPTGESKPLALIYLDDPDRFEPALSQKTFRRALALSMAELGTPALSRSVLKPGDMDEPSTAAAIAEAYLDADDPREALDAASHLPEGPLKRQLVTNAMLAEGRSSEAMKLLSELHRDDDQATLRARARAALSTGDWVNAMSALGGILEEDADPLIASQLAMAALQAGEPVLPETVVEVLTDTDPDRLSMFRALFGEDLPVDFIDNPELVSGFLKSLDSETAAIQELLKDG